MNNSPSTSAPRWTIRRACHSDWPIAVIADWVGCVATVAILGCGTVEESADASTAVDAAPDAAVDAAVDAAPDAAVDAASDVYLWTPDGERTATLIFGNCSAPTESEPIPCDETHDGLVVLTALGMDRKTQLRNFQSAQAQGDGVQISLDRRTIVITGWGACGGDVEVAVTARVTRCVRQ